VTALMKNGSAGGVMNAGEIKPVSIVGATG
jgi:hypothetical protein